MINKVKVVLVIFGMLLFFVYFMYDWIFLNNSLVKVFDVSGGGIREFVININKYIKSYVGFFFWEDCVKNGGF